MKILLRCVAIAAALTASFVAGAEGNKLYIVGDATPGGWELDMAQALEPEADNSSVYSGTLHLNEEGEFKFLSRTEWGGTEYGLAPLSPEAPDIHKYKAPLYWSVYEYCYTREQQGDKNIDISPSEWDKIIDWVARDLKPFGYDMICTDGFIPMLSKDATGYMTDYGSISLKDLIARCKAKGLKVGIYDNPLWIHGPMDTPIQGTSNCFGDLVYNSSNSIRNPGVNDTWFTWAIAENPGCREFIDGFFKHYKELGVDYIRIDFLSWYEDGTDRGMGIVGRGYGRDSYAKALSYIAESAAKYDIFISLVMPHLYNDAELESKYGNMIRIVADTTTGGWRHCSAANRGTVFPTWPNCDNQFDGYTYWSKVSGRDKVILDGDFIRLNTFADDNEKMTEISLHLMAGGPLTVADEYFNIGDDVKFYTNEEMLALNTDRFVGKPLSNNLNDPNHQIWYGQMTNGDYVVALFNREDNERTVSVNFADLGIEGEWEMRDLWLHRDEGKSHAVSASIPPHGCKILRLSSDSNKLADRNRNNKMVVEPTENEVTAGVDAGGDFILSSGSLDNGYSKLSVGRTGNYNIRVDVENMTATLKYSPYQDTKINHSTLYLVGDATPGGWSVADGTPLLQNEDFPGIYSAKVALHAGGSFKIAHSLRGATSWNPQYFFFRHADDDAKISTNGDDDRKWSVDNSGDYNVTVNSRDMTINITPSASSSIETLTADHYTPIYYNLQGMPVNNPSNGIYIKVTGSHSQKIFLN